jgi:hypothetical protein
MSNSTKQSYLSQSENLLQRLTSSSASQRRSESSTNTLQEIKYQTEMLIKNEQTKKAEYLYIQILHLINNMIAATSEEDEANKAMQTYI